MIPDDNIPNHSLSSLQRPFPSLPFCPSTSYKALNANARLYPNGSKKRIHSVVKCHLLLKNKTCFLSFCCDGTEGKSCNPAQSRLYGACKEIDNWKSDLFQFSARKLIDRVVVQTWTSSWFQMTIYRTILSVPFNVLSQAYHSVLALLTKLLMPMPDCIQMEVKKEFTV